MQYCMSDIHGCYDLFCSLLDRIAFSDEDTMYILGDMIDKGPQSVRLLRMVFSMPNVVCIAGNHEFDFLKLCRALLREGDANVPQQLRDFFADGALLTREVIGRLFRLPFWVEGEKWLGVHAGIPLRPDGTLCAPAEAAREQLVYDRRFKEPDVLPRAGKCVLFGHTPVRYLTGRDEIVFYPRPGAPQGSEDLADYCKVHLDLMTAKSGVAGCVCLDDCRTFYVQEK